MSLSNVTKSKLYLASSLLLLMLLVAGYYYVNINTGLTRSEILASLKIDNTDSIEYYMLYPVQSRKSILLDTIYIESIEDITRISSELNTMKRFEANHPISNWSINLKAKFKNKELQNFHFKIMQADSINGTCIWLYKDRPNIEFNLGSYRNDRLSEILKDIIAN